MNQLCDLLAPAKLNLFLHVLGRRDDGYHELQSVFVLIDWCDRIHLSARADGHITRLDLAGTQTAQALPAQDLCVRAALLLQTASATSLGCDITLEKHLPSGAGLGGGSSDAATVLLGLNRLWGLNWPRQKLLELAAQLGADVPFFVGGNHAFVQGIGEQLTPLALPAALLQRQVVVIKPPCHVPTAAIFNSALLRRDSPAVEVDDFLASPWDFGRNDLQPPALAWRAPEQDHDQSDSQGRDIERALQLLQRELGGARMTGSGSAVFGWVDPATPVDAQTLAGWIHELGPHWQVRLCRLLPHHPWLDRAQ